MNEKFKVEIAEKNLLQRAKGNLEISFVEAQGETTLAKLYQSGSLRVLIPKSFSRSKEAIIINTGGGIIGGDKFSFSINSEKNTETWITTQAAEKIYKSTGDLSRVEIDINLGENASLFWCPQETILFDKSKLFRSMNISVKKSSNLFIVENVVLGRLASGEFSKNCHFSDQWRIKIDQKLTLAENFLLTGCEELCSKAKLGHNNTVCTMVYVSSNAERYLKTVREIIIQSNVIGGASFWNKCLVARIVTQEPAQIRALTVSFLNLFSRQGEPIPRVWSI